MMKFTFLLLLFATFFQPSFQAYGAKPGNVILNLDSIAHVSCFGQNDGAIFISILDGVPPFSIEWSNGDTTLNLLNLPAGVYSVSVTDDEGDVAILEGIEIIQPDELTISLTHLELPGCAGQTGALEVTAEGGIPPYEYAWSSGQTTDVIDGLSAGYYELVVTDANGCTAVLDYSLEPEYPGVSLEADGNITCTHPVVTLDGTGSSFGDDFVFTWNAENGGQFISATDSLVVWTDAAGSYTLEIINLLNGCSSLATLEVAVDTILPIVDAGPDLDVPCTNSEVTINGDGSTGSSFTHEWSSEDSGNIIEGGNTLSPLVNHAGTYILTTKNLENGCSASDTMTVTGANEPPVAAVQGGELTCLTTEIQLAVEADTSGTSFKWTGPGGFSSDELSPLVSTVGEYLFTITDTMTTCTTVAVAEVLENTTPPVVETSGGILTCTHSTVTLTATAESADVIFTWSGPNGFSSFEPNPEVSEAGEYTLEAIDTLTGCVAAAIETVGIDTLAPTADAGTGGTLTCAVPSLLLDGSASSQGDDYAYLWTTDDGIILSGEETLTPEVGAAGTYTLTVTNQVNGCTDTDEVEVFEDTLAPDVDAVGGVITCFEPSTQLTGIFDTTHVSFVWEGPNGFTSFEQNPVASAGGDYFLIVTDTLNGCSSTATATVIAFTTAPELTLTASDTITCAITEATLTVSSQLQDVVYAWSGPNGYQSGDSIITVTDPGVFTVLAIELVYGCIALDSITLEGNLVAPVANAGTGFNLDCHVTSGLLDGTLSSQGAEFTYAWSTQDGNIVSGEETLTPEVDAAGTYTLTVTNTGNGCISSDEAEVVQIAPVTAEISNVTNVSCHGSADGSATVTAGGGVGNFTYAWSSGSLNATATGLVVGSYSVTVYDGSNCTAEATVIIGQPTVLTANASATAQSLAGVDDGTATANPDGGTSPYSFEWSNGETTQDISDLAPGAYTVIITDANGCTAIETVNVNAFDCILTGTISATDVTCFGDATGTATVILENAIAPIQFTWSNGDTLATAANLAAGVYNVTASDSTNCSISLTITVNQPTPIIVSELFHTNLTCTTDQNGSVTVAANGGAQPYSFVWFDGSEGPSISGLGIGDYDVVVTDGNGCEVTYTTTISSDDNEPPTLVLQDITVSLDENGQAVITAEMFDAGSSDNCGIATWSVSPESFDCSQTGDQTVTITVIDLNGNESSANANVTILDDQAPVLVCPDNVVISACNTELFYDLPAVTDNCFANPDLLQLTEGLPSGAEFPAGLTTQTFSYTDDSGNAGTCSFTVEVVEALAVSYTLSNVSCAGACDGSINLTLSNGLEPYQILWSNGDSGEELNGLCAGSYTASITDEGGCSLELTLEISEPAALVIGVLAVENPACAEDATGEITVEAAGGVQPYEILWSTNATTETVSGLLPGTYTVVVTDANSCTTILSVPVIATDSEAPVLSLQNVTVQLGANGMVTLNPADFDAGSTDNCSIASWTVSPTNFDCGDLGTHTVVLVATDSNGNSSVGQAQVTVVDNIAPVLTCPANITAGYCNPAVLFPLPQVSDNCTPDLAQLQQIAGLPSGATFPAGPTLQTFSYTDAGGNAGTCSFTVTVGTVATVSATVDNVSCFGNCDGEITLTISGGTPPFTIAWSNGQTGLTATGLCAGTYTASVTDPSSCLQVLTTVVTQPAALQLTVDLVNNDVGGASQGDIFISVSGGTTPYTFQWTRNGQNIATTEDLLNILAGQYQVTVKDANGCEISSANITVENMVSTNEPSWSNNLRMLPNPASAWVQLSFENALTQEVDVVFLDAAGRSVSSAKIANGQQEIRLEISDLAPGFYTVQLRSATATAFRRLIVSR